METIRQKNSTNHHLLLLENLFILIIRICLEQSQYSYSMIFFIFAIIVQFASETSLA